MSLKTGSAPDVTDRTARLSCQVQELLERSAELVPFHDWRHTAFVCKKATEFARERSADVPMVEAAALVHDLNYLVRQNSSPSAGRGQRHEILGRCGFAPREISRIEAIIEGAHTAHRGRRVDVETACLSDADTLYKTLPITPVMFSHRYLDENGIPLGVLAEKIVREQVSKLRDDYYFYDSRLTERYRHWAEANLRLWEAVLESLEDPDVLSLID